MRLAQFARDHSAPDLAEKLDQANTAVRTLDLLQSRYPPAVNALIELRDYLHIPAVEREYWRIHRAIQQGMRVLLEELAEEEDYETWENRKIKEAAGILEETELEAILANMKFEEYQYAQERVEKAKSKRKKEER